MRGSYGLHTLAATLCFSFWSETALIWFALHSLTVEQSAINYNILKQHSAPHPRTSKKSKYNIIKGNTFQNMKPW